MSTSEGDLEPGLRGPSYEEEKFGPVSARAHVSSLPTQTVKVSRNQTQYVRQQKGHSLILWLLLGGIVLWIPAIYYTASPNHFWHA